MSSLHHTPLPNGAPLTTRAVNAVFGQLDQALTDILTGDKGWLVRGSTPSTPASGYAKLYFKSNTLYLLPSSGVEAQISGGDVKRIVNFAELGSPASGLTLSNIPATYKHLWLRLRVRTDLAAAQDQLLIQCNGDTTAANYYTSNWDGTTHNTALGTVSGIKVWSVPAASGSANLLAALDIFVFDYVSTTRTRGVNYNGVSTPETASAGNYRAISGGGTWNNTSAALTSLSIVPVGGSNLTADSAYELLGIA